VLWRQAVRWRFGEEVRKFGVVVDNSGEERRAKTKALREAGTKGRKMLKFVGAVGGAFVI